MLTQPALVSLNNQVAQLAVQDMQNYIKEVSTTLNDNQSETSVITDTLSVGMMLYMLPKVQNSDVFLQVSSNLSELKALDSVAVGSGTASATEIQLPNITQRIINQRAVVPSGATLVLSGFKSIKDANADDKFFGFELLGGRAAQKKSIEIIILITPTILSSEDTMEEVS